MQIEKDMYNYVIVLTFHGASCCESRQSPKGNAPHERFRRWRSAYRRQRLLTAAAGASLYAIGCTRANRTRADVSKPHGQYM